jgi:hypothetical protein
VFFAAMGTTVVCLLGIGVAMGRAQAQRPPLAEEVFKNVPMLRGMPVDEFMDTMGMFSAATGLNCTDCHTTNSLDDWANFAADTPVKQTARRMIVMVNALNKTSFGGERKVTCFTCHQGGSRPRTIPDLAVQYGVPPENPNDIDIAGPDMPGLPSAAQVLDNYITAIGGAQRVAGLTNYVAKGTYAGFDTDHVAVPVELYAKAPDQRAMVVHAPFGDKISTYDGRAGWMASADRPIPLMPLTGGNLYGARVEAFLAFPGQIRQAFTEWHVGMTTIDERDVYVVQGIRAGQLPVNLYFDRESALLVRLVRWNDTAIGRVPTQVDYADYRDLLGVKVPFRWVTTWTNGQSTIALSEAQPNVPIDATRFARPAPAVAH